MRQSDYFHNLMKEATIESYKEPINYRLIVTDLRHSLMSPSCRQFDTDLEDRRLTSERRRQVTTEIVQKYPRPVHSSRNRVECVTCEAQHMGQRATHDEQLSRGIPQSESR
jgi:hypothetical protein